jgi:hypothetical protein
MPSTDQFAALQEVWGDLGEAHSSESSGLDSRRRRMDVTAPTCRPKGAEGDEDDVWCNLYYDGYSHDVDAIMDMYTPGDGVPDDARYNKVPFSRSQAPQQSTDGPRPYREHEPRVVSTVLPMTPAMTSREDLATFPYTPYDASPFAAFAPYQAEDQAPPRRAVKAKLRRPKRAPQDVTHVPTTYDGLSTSLYDDEFARADVANSCYHDEVPKRGARAFRNIGNGNGNSNMSGNIGTDDTNSEDNYDYHAPRDASPPQPEPQPQQPTSLKGPREAFQQQPSQPQATQIPNSNLYMELALYVLSGILLIIAMEQFVQIGLHMR